MGNQESWKKTEDREIDLVDLLRKLCMGWKQALLCALLFAVLLGGFGFIKGRAANGQGAGQANGNALLDKEELTEEEERDVWAAVQLESQTRALEEYLDNSALMQIDPFHKDRVVMLYKISGAKRRDLQGIVESYISYIADGGAADALKDADSKEWDMAQCYLSELILANQKAYAAPYQVIGGISEADSQAEAVFYVEVTGKDAKMAKRLAANLQPVLEQYYKKAAGIAGSHKLELLSSVIGAKADNLLQGQQNDKRELLKANLANLKSMTDAFNKGQSAAYEEAVGMESEQGHEDGLDDAGTHGLSLKYIFVGFVGGIFVYCGIFACWYLFLDTVKSMREMKGMYTFPIYGGIPLGGNASKKDNAFGREKEKLAGRLRLACKRQGISELYAVSDFALNSQEKECIGNLAGQLKKCGIEILTAEDTKSDAANWDNIAKCRNVLMVCRIGATTHQAIDDAMGFYEENGIAVIGAMAFVW